MKVTAKKMIEAIKKGNNFKMGNIEVSFVGKDLDSCNVYLYGNRIGMVVPNGFVIDKETFDRYSTLTTKKYVNALIETFGECK